MEAAKQDEMVKISRIDRELRAEGVSPISQPIIMAACVKLGFEMFEDDRGEQVGYRVKQSDSVQLIEHLRERHKTREEERAEREEAEKKAKAEKAEKKNLTPKVLAERIAVLEEQAARFEKVMSVLSAKWAT